MYRKENLANKITEATFPNLKKEMLINVQEANTRNTRKNEPPCHITIKILNLQNRERLVKVSREKDQVKNKGQTIRLTSTSQWRP